jgi:hypothetical protein
MSGGAAATRPAQECGFRVGHAGARVLDDQGDPPRMAHNGHTDLSGRWRVVEDVVHQGVHDGSEALGREGDGDGLVGQVHVADPALVLRVRGPEHHAGPHHGTDVARVAEVAGRPLDGLDDPVHVVLHAGHGPADALGHRTGADGLRVQAQRGQRGPQAVRDVGDHLPLLGQQPSRAVGGGVDRLGQRDQLHRPGELDPQVAVVHADLPRGVGQHADRVQRGADHPAAQHHRGDAAHDRHQEQQPDPHDQPGRDHVRRFGGHDDRGVLRRGGDPQAAGEPRGRGADADRGAVGQVHRQPALRTGAGAGDRGAHGVVVGRHGEDRGGGLPRLRVGARGGVPRVPRRRAPRPAPAAGPARSRP